MIDNLAPFDEIFMGSNFKSYKHTYFVSQIHDVKYKLQNYQRSEVADIGWYTYEECMDKIRDYNIERKNILARVNNILTSCIKDL